MEKREKQISIMPIYLTPTIDNVLGKAREFIDDFMLSSQNKGIYNHMGVQPDKVFLLEGEKGTGKTLAISALNNTLNKDVFLSALNGDTTLASKNFKLAVLPYDIGTYGTAYINMSSVMVQNFFEYAYNLARSTNVLISIDEADALLSARNESGIQSHQEDRKTLETLMKNLQVSHDTPGIYVVLMTNFAELCDSASLRAGRIDKKYKFELPTTEERTTAFSLAASQINSKAGYQVVRSFNPQNLAELSEGFNYADIVASVEAAVKTRVKELASDRTEKILVSGYVTQNRLEKEVISHKSSFVKNKRRRIGLNNE